MVEFPFHMNNNYSIFLLHFRLRKVKMDQRKLMDNANTITDMAKVSSPFFLMLEFNRLADILQKYLIDSLFYFIVI